MEDGGAEYAPLVAVDADEDGHNDVSGQPSPPEQPPAQALQRGSTAAEAAVKAQLQERGYSGVRTLTRDTAGNWSAKAMRNNVEVAVTIDAAGNIREQ